MEAVYKRVLIKVSGEALAGDKKTGFAWLLSAFGIGD